MADPSGAESNEVDNTSNKLDRQAAAEFGERLRARAAEKGVSAAQLSRLSGIPKQSISGYWAGRRVPRHEKLFRLSEALDMDPRRLASGNEPGSIAADLPHDQLALARGVLTSVAAEHPVLTEVRGAGAVGFDELTRMVFGEEPLAPLPLYGSAQGGDLDDDFALTELDISEVLDYLRRPAALADDGESYALTIVGSSMTPRFKPGERVGVSPRARVEIGDDVIVQVRGENSNRVRRVLIKELVRRSAGHVTLKQHNPARELRVERSDILSMHKVKGHFL